MTDAIPIRAGERGIVRVFALDLPQDAVARFADPSGDWPLRSALGAERLDPDRVKVFPVTDLEGVGLAGYLSEGLGVTENQLAPDAAMLDAVEGHVVVLPSAALGGVAQTLRARPPLRHLGTYAEEAAPVAFEPLPSDSATGMLAGSAADPSPAGGGWVAKLVIAALALLVLGLLSLAFAEMTHV